MPTLSSHRAPYAAPLTLVALLSFGACSQRSTTSADLSVVSDVLSPDLEPVCDTADDWDKDGIDNGAEGCLEGRDSDGDGTLDFQDFDSDGDGVLDRIEAGTKGKCVGLAKERWPCDSDGDGTPDYLDTDSDGDGLLDGEEDANGDGLLGCCLRECGKPERDQVGGPVGTGCVLNEEGCGGEQRCVAGGCSPLVDYSCAEGETDRTRKDTFGKGKLDPALAFFVCREGEAQGRRTLQKRASSSPMSDPKSGGWRLALRMSAAYKALTLHAPKNKEAAAAIDYRAADEQVAGFVLSMPATKANLSAELSAIINKLKADPPGLASATVSVMSPGVPGKSHDRYDIVRGTQLRLANVHDDAGALRNDIIASILGRGPTTLGPLPSPLGNRGQEFVIHLATIRRFAFAEDSRGNPMLDGDGYPLEDEHRPDGRRLLVIGAVAVESDYGAFWMKSGLIVDDLAGGSAIAEWTYQLTEECDTHVVASEPPIVLDYRPIASSLAVAVNGAVVSRSRAKGFDYHAQGNRLVFIDMDEKKGAEVVVGYWRWQRTMSPPY